MIDKQWIDHQLPPSMLPIERTRRPKPPATPRLPFATGFDSGRAFELIDQIGIPMRRDVEKPIPRFFHAGAGALQKLGVQSGDRLRCRR